LRQISGLHVGIDHYENFPVASVLLPARLRAPVEAIYHFAREADDIVDEGDATPQARLAALDARLLELDRMERGEVPELPLYRELAVQTAAHRLPTQPLRDLLDAFRQDVTKTRYADFGELMHYCRRSANPIGRLLLHLYGETAPRSLAMSDGICSALQLINFLQDVDSDYRDRGRVYIPQDEMARFGISDQDIASRLASPGWRRLMNFQRDRARRLLQAGAPLGRVLRGRIGLELRAIVMGGDRVLEKLHAADGDVFGLRPVLRGLDWPLVFWRALVR
jgi:squalene synthase HpnC